MVPTLKFMKIRQKLLITYLGLTTVALLLVSSWTYVSQTRALKTQVSQQLEAIAEIQKNRLQHMLVQNKERLALVTSRTQLRLSLKKFLKHGQQQQIQKISRILNDAQKSVTDFKVISITDTKGKVIVSTDDQLRGKKVYTEVLLAKARQRANVDTLERRGDGEMYLMLSAPLILEGLTIGLIVIEADAHIITDLTSDYTGLGETGETLLATRLNEKEIIFITPLRFDPDAALNRIAPIHDKQLSIVQAIERSRLSSKEMHDYRQIPVLAATRFIEGAKWGLAVKIDSQEALAPIETLRSTLIFIGVVVLLLIVIFSFLLANMITRPLHSLTRAATRIASGDYSRSVSVISHDETGMLARVFNRMTSALQEARNKLDEQFKQLTEEVHERKLAEKKLKEYQDHLEDQVATRTVELSASNEELKAFCYTVTHDLRAPLRGIDGFSQAIEEDCSEQLDDTGKGYLSRIHGNVQRMGALIDDILRFSSVTGGDVQYRDINISELCSDIISDYLKDEPTRQTDITIEENIHENGDEQLVRIVLENLISNAWKYSSKKTLSRINVYRTVTPDGIGTICVKDNGAGFDMTHSHKLFTPFQRCHGGDYEGSGIGLATVQRIVQRHKGKIWADATPGEGAIFCFTLS